MTVREIYDCINRHAPFSNQSPDDNSGLLIGDASQKVTGILLTLDITNDTVSEAVSLGANLILSHHPVIFRPLKAVLPHNPVSSLIQNGISAICAHTNTDVMPDGLTAILVQKLGGTPIDVIEPANPDGTGYGFTFEEAAPVTAEQLSQRCKKAFGCTVIRYFDAGKPIRKVGICSGAGGSLLERAVDMGCDAFITGDVKHSLWIDAKNMGITLIDAGHFHTEIIFCDYMKKVISPFVSGIPVFVAKTAVDPCQYY